MTRSTEYNPTCNPSHDQSEADRAIVVERAAGDQLIDVMKFR